MGALLQDLRYGLRMLAKNPGFTAVAVLTLALGIGANTSIFTAVNALMLHPFPFEHLNRLVAVWETAPQQNENHAAAAPANFRDWREQSHSFQDLAAGHGWEVNLTGAGAAERVDGYRVTPRFFPLLGLPAQLGRTLTAQDFESGRTSAVVVGYGFWQRRLGANPGVIGSRVRLNNEEYTIVGVMPVGFDYPAGIEVWAPLDLRRAEQTDRFNHFLRVIGRLQPGVSMAQAQADLQAIAGRLAQQFPPTNAGHSVRLVNLVDELLSGSRQFVLVLMGAAGFVLLLACANVANLQLARSSSRRKEIAVRVSLGASRAGVARQLLVESVLQSVLGGLAGLVLASWHVDWMRHSVPPFIMEHIPGFAHLRIDGYVLAFTAGIAVAAGILAGVAFAWHASRTDLNETLKESSRGAGSSASSHRLRGLLVVTEITLALVLLTGAGLMVEGFRHLAKTEMGFDRQNVLTFQIALPEAKYRQPTQVREFYNQLVDRLGALPGVESSAAALTLPGEWDWNRTLYAAENQPAAAPGEMRLTAMEPVTPEFFRTLRIPLVAGRTLSAQDGPDQPRVAVLNSSFARQLWPGENPLGKRLHFGSGQSVAPWCTVVGVVGDIKPSPWDDHAPPMAYFPFAQVTYNAFSVAIRTHGDPTALVAAARAQVQTLDAEQPVFNVRTLEKIIDDDLSGVSASARMMVVYGLIALVLSASGIFGLMAYSVAQRTHEIGVRMALGAQHQNIIRMVVGQALKLALLGLAIGVPTALALTRALSSVLLGVIRVDPQVFAGFTLLLALVAAFAAYLPARWATKVDPMEALRYE